MGIGIEVRDNILADLNEMYTSHKIDHVQVTVPNLIPFMEITSLTEKYNIIIHSNLLNVLGKNNFSELACFAKQIKAIDPKYVIEHFTMFMDSAGKKQGVALPVEESAEKIVDMACKNIVEWKNILNTEIALENAPITENALAYFELLLKVKTRSKCHITVDIPHLIISLSSVTENEREEILSILTKLKPRHLHIAGIAIHGDKLRDSHHLAGIKSVIAFSKHLFPEVAHITIEQGPQVKGEQLKKIIESIPLIEGKNDYDFNKLRVEDHKEINQNLAEDSFDDIIKGKKSFLVDEEINKEQILDSNDLYNKYSPFYYPLNSLRLITSDLNSKELLKSSILFARWGLKFSSWFDPKMDSFNVIYGEKDHEILKANVDVQDHQKEYVLFDSYNEYFFGSAQAAWVKLQSPRYKRSVS